MDSICHKKAELVLGGKDGLWQKYDPVKLASAQGFRDDPKLVWSWYNDRRKKILAAKPNAGHIAIANLQNHREVSVVTQNVDGLHHIAGSRVAWKHLCN
jgi:NAD-dependent deacetylase